MAIPKVIHYCWFGGNKKSHIIRKCIRSWKKYCPGYDIIEWNEQNFNVNQNEYCKVAYQEQRWAFLSDYVRLKVLFDHGGIYMDTDVQLLRPIGQFLNHSCFMGFQHESYVSNGLVTGAVAGHPFLQEHMKIYEDMKLGGDVKTERFIICQEYTTNLLIKKGLQMPYYGKDVVYVEDIAIYPKDYFCPYDIRTNTLEKTKNTIAIHHFTSSWWGEKWRKIRKRRIIALRIYEIIHIPNMIFKRWLGDTNYDRMKQFIKKVISWQFQR